MTTLLLIVCILTCLPDNYWFAKIPQDSLLQYYTMMKLPQDSLIKMKYMYYDATHLSLFKDKIN